jgi:beta-galactosidase/beta-glucuronidase
MKTRLISSFILLLAFTTFLPAQTWKPADGPLVTRWAKDVSPEKVLPEYPRPQMVRSEWLNLNGLWQLEKSTAEAKIEFGKTLPMQILVPFPIESALSGVMQHADRIVYRRTFEVPKKWEGKHILLHFDAVDWEATVFVNGKELGTHRGGFDAFSFDITDALKSEGQQELIVKVFDPSDRGSQPCGKQSLKPEGCFYTTATGIWQTVWLEPVSSISIKQLKMVPDVDNSCLRLSGDVQGVDDQTVEAVAFDGKSEVARAAGTLETGLKIDIPKDKLKLWSPETPFLYDLVVTIKKDNKTIDEVKSYFGMRKIDLGKDENGVLRMRLNNKPYFQAGPLDQGYWPDGIYTAPTDEALRFDIEKTKELGFNMIRKHMKVEPARWYYWCDKLGIVIWQDMPSLLNFKQEERKQFETELDRMIDGRFNHPSIIVWVVFNEGWGQHDTPYYVANVKRRDPSRLTDNASGWVDKMVGDLRDAHIYPGPGCPDPDPNRALVLGEFGGLGLNIEGHRWQKDGWGYRGMKSGEELTARYCALLRKAYELNNNKGLCAVVYTQTTDVETECNGLMTYDRAVIKVDLKKVADANQGRFPKLKTLLPTARETSQKWSYTFDKPADDWFKPEFDAASWKSGESGFGTDATPGATVRTTWNTSDIWLRREVELKDFKPENLRLLLHHDEDAEVYVNGVLVAKVAEFTTDYDEPYLDAPAAAAFKQGKNIIAIHCKQTIGGQFIDLGIVEQVAE